MFSLTHVLVCVCALISLLQFTQQQDWVIDDSGCITPDNAVGDCIDINDCEPFIYILDLHVKRKKTVSERLKGILAKHLCGIGKVTKVCCPRAYKIPTPSPTTKLPLDDKIPTSSPTTEFPIDYKTPTPSSTAKFSVIDKTPTPTPTPSPTTKFPIVDKTPTATPTTTNDSIVFKTPRINASPVPILNATMDNPAVINNTINLSPPPLPFPENPPLNVSTPEPGVVTNLTIVGRTLLPQDGCGLFEGEDKVSDGDRAGLFEFPWMALLAYETSNGIEFLCGGTLINNRYILTAAHCLVNTIGRKLAYIRLGEFDITNTTDCDEPLFGDKTCLDPTEDILPENVIIHPEYNFRSRHNDIGLIRLERNVKMKDHIRPICLPITTELQSADLKNVVLTGWGLTENNTRSDILLKAEVSIMDRTECRKIYKRSFVTITGDQMCAGGLTRKGSCTGDSGGPIQVLQIQGSDIKYVQYGVLSLGFSICGGLFPGIHTSVISYIDWIIATLQP